MMLRVYDIIYKGIIIRNSGCICYCTSLLLCVMPKGEQFFGNTRRCRYIPVALSSVCCQLVNTACTEEHWLTIGLCDCEYVLAM